MPAIGSLTFEQWIEHAFSHEIRRRGNPWYFDEDPPWWDPGAQEAVDHLTRLFERPLEALEWFSDAQIAQGLTYLVNTSESGDNSWLYHRSVSGQDRHRCILAIATLFEQLFAPRCLPILGHLDRTAESPPLNSACYMWWDVFPRVALPDDPDCDRLQRATLEVMERALGLGSIACQESALHGLGHANRRYPQDLQRIVDRFLAGDPALPPELVAYAQSARDGCVL
jgi:hypothetical protein